MSSIALQLPNTYVEFEREEMEYVDGGSSIHTVERSIDKRVLEWPINALGWYFTGGAITKGLGMLSSTVYKALGGILGETGINSVISGIASKCGDWSNFGTMLANHLDSIDIHPNNGRLDYYDTVRY